jgi:xanthine/uracil permease
MTKQDVVAMLVAVAFTGLMILMLYLLFNRWWAALPPWVTLPVTILISIAAIGSPIYTLKKISDRAFERHLARRQSSKAEDRG